jgi:hypothetical protein
MAHAIAQLTSVIRVDVDLNADLMVGLHRAPSLAAVHNVEKANMTRYDAPSNSRLRAQLFQELITPKVTTVIAYAWPGIDNTWIRQLIHAGKSAGALTIIACASLPQPGHARASTLAGILAKADVVIVGDKQESRELTSIYGRSGPVIEAHPALSLDGRSGRQSKERVTAFIPKGDSASLAALLRAFDAIPEAWIDAYQLQVVMRIVDGEAQKAIDESHHRKHVELIGDMMSDVDLYELFASSSALGIASPLRDSRVFSAATKSGIGTVVFDGGRHPEVGHGYVGGLLAHRSRTASLHVAMIHALRHAELQFPSPETWDALAQRVAGVDEREGSAVTSNVGVQ